MVYSNVAPGRQWSYEADGKTVMPRVRYRLSANNGEFLTEVACQGKAIVNGPLALLNGHIERGELVRILADYQRPAVGIYAVYPPGRLVSRRVKALSEALYEYFRGRDI